MITIFLTPDSDYNFGIIERKVIDETTLVKSPNGTCLYRGDIGGEGVWWHRNLGKAKECIRKRKAEKITKLKLEIIKIKQLELKVVKSKYNDDDGTSPFAVKQ